MHVCLCLRVRVRLSARGALMDASVDTVALIHASEPEGDILLFLTGQDEIDNTCKQLRTWADDYDVRLKRAGP